ncbi:MAG: HIT family protein [Patescibacteria group bacterium]
MGKTKCFACDVNNEKIHVPGKLIHRDELWVVDHAIGRRPDDPIPLMGFLIICPVRHVEQIHMLTDEELLNFGLLLKDVANALNKVLAPEKIHVCSFGESVRHVHWYVIPRSAGMPQNGYDVLRGIFRDKKWACSVKDAAATALKVKSELEQLFATRGGSRSTPYSHLF